jgi:MFS transporter, DHA1 family, multidrug resistance protein
MKDIIRDSTVGQVINSLSGGWYLPYAEQRSDYTVPAHFLLPPSTSQADVASIDEKKIPARTESATPADAEASRRTSRSLTRLNSPVEGYIQDNEKGEVDKETVVFDPYLVGWYDDHDQENPR